MISKDTLFEHDYDYNMKQNFIIIMYASIAQAIVHLPLFSRQRDEWRVGIYFSYCLCVSVAYFTAVFVTTRSQQYRRENFLILPGLNRKTYLILEEE